MLRQWAVSLSVRGKQWVMDLGSYDVLSLADARKKARELRAQVALGHYVADEKQECKRSAHQAGGGALRRYRGAGGG